MSSFLILDQILIKGAVYVFIQNGTGSWIQQQKVNAVNGTNNDLFGWSVSLEENVVAIGCPYDVLNAQEYQPGSVYLFIKSGSSWVQGQQLTLSNRNLTDQFGYSVSLSGINLLVGAPFSQFSDQQGMAYVFVENGSNWSFQQILTADNGNSSDGFGYSVSISGTTISIGAPGFSFVEILNITSEILFQTTLMTTFMFQTTEMTTELPQTPTPEVSKNNSASIDDTIIGVVVGIVGFLLILGLVLLFLIWRRNKRNRPKIPDATLIELDQQSILLTDELVLEEKIGAGNFGEVYKARLGHFTVAVSPWHELFQCIHNTFLCNVV